MLLDFLLIFFTQAGSAGKFVYCGQHSDFTTVMYVKYIFLHRYVMYVKYVRYVCQIRLFCIFVSNDYTHKMWILEFWTLYYFEFPDLLRVFYIYDTYSFTDFCLYDGRMNKIAYLTHIPIMGPGAVTGWAIYTYDTKGVQVFS